MRRNFPLLLALVSLILFTGRASAEETLPELIRRVKPSVVSVIAYDAKGNMATTGSGFFIRPGQVVTNLHVIEGAHHAEIRTFDGKGKTFPVDAILDVDLEGDLAILGISMPPERARSLEISSSVPEEGEKIFVIGNPLRMEGSIADGIVSAVREVPNLAKIIQITAPISHGNSGSPLFNMKGEVVGVVTMVVTNGQNINLALASSRVSALEPEKPLSFEELAAKLRGSPQADAVSERWYLNGLNSLWLGNYESALGYFEIAVNKNPGRAEAWIQVGYCKVKQGKNRDAIRAFQQALRLRPTSVVAYNKLGDAYFYSGSFNEAIDAYKQAARLNPRQPEAYYNLGITYLEIGDRASAISQSRLLEHLDTKLYDKLLSEIHR
ncbi:MAG TPA: tetratricopeptide repeat-containing serine protease family protein [Pyrinomonadaceae bacterium]|jgi:tetratricopeptide (TPR) repeat protein|nr:tetratricopeptide repeat-containing serine protease family protein [Pyrinomonadaceae bacterium]